jgi:hypothetical protein
MLSRLKMIGQPAGCLELGQGVRLRPGERPVLYLSERAKRDDRPDAIAEIRRDGGFYLDGHRIEPLNRSVLQTAMKLVQQRKGHRNSKGELISLSAWRQWHVCRRDRMVSMVDLKDPKLTYKRPRLPELTLGDLDL